MKKLIVVFLIIPLIIVMVVNDPQGAGHLMQIIITIGAKLLGAVAAFLNQLLAAFGH